jgi:hypothetical protein
VKDLHYAAVHWPANAGGEHPDRETIYQLPGVSRGALMMCADSARYWYDEARSRCPLVVWRAIPRQGKLPAQLGWNAEKVADECLNLWNEQPHSGVEWFTPLNELQFVKEAGESWRGYQYMASRLAVLRVELRSRLPASVQLLFPAWVPSDDGTSIDQWGDEAMLWDGLVLHAYGDADTMRSRYQSYRDAFPDKPIIVGEYNANHSGADEWAALEMWADIATTDERFLGATYYIWETLNSGEVDLSVWGNPERLARFQAPPVLIPIPDPVPPPEPEPPIVPTTTVTYARDTPAIAQNDPWSCAPTSARWAMTAVGRHPSEAWFEGQMLADGIVTKEDGLLDATGHQLAAWLTTQYQEFGYSASNDAATTFDGLAAEFGPGCPYPALIGGRAWGHWSGLRGYDSAQGVLLLANPAENWKGVSQTMSRAQYDALGPFSMVRIVHPDLIAPAPAPTPAPDPIPTPAPAPLWTVQDGPFAGLTGPQLQQKAEALVTAVAYQSDTVGDALTALVKELQRVRNEQVGARS